jgi:hypothetical protein
VTTPTPPRRDCERCGGPMERTIAQLPDPGPDGQPVIDERDECVVCGHTWQVLGDEWDRPEVRRRIAVVRAHREVTDHAGCGPDAPCQARRPGLPAPGPLPAVA